MFAASDWPVRTQNILLSPVKSVQLAFPRKRGEGGLLSRFGTEDRVHSLGRRPQRSSQLSTLKTFHVSCGNAPLFRMYNTAVDLEIRPIQAQQSRRGFSRGDS